MPRHLPRSAGKLCLCIAAASDLVRYLAKGAYRNIGEITRDIVIDGDLPEAARARLLLVADRCPIHTTLTREIKIRTRLVS
jgi:uncharacterized OsmC-like protein